MIRPDGLHWTSAYEIARRGGMVASKIIAPRSADGYIQDSMEENSAEIKRAVDESRSNIGRSRNMEDPVPMLNQCVKQEREMSTVMVPTLTSALGQGRSRPRYGGSPPGETRRKRGDTYRGPNGASRSVWGFRSAIEAVAEQERDSPVLFGPDEYRNLTERASACLNLTP